eukprot:5110102-Alexandrium_andersonii.AAC.1
MALTRHCGPWAYLPPLARVSGFPDGKRRSTKRSARRRRASKRRSTPSTRTASRRSSRPPRGAAWTRSC